MNAMKFFLYRFREELGIDCTDYELFGSVFPELLPSTPDDKKEVASRVQATSRYGDKNPRQLLSYVAKSTLLPEQFVQLRETISIIERHSHQGKAIPVDAMRRLTKRSAEKSYGGIFAQNMKNLASKALVVGESFDSAAAPFLVMFSQQDAKDDVKSLLRKVWHSRKKGDLESYIQAKEELWRWCVHDEAKNQLVEYVRSMIKDGFSRGTVLGLETVMHYKDRWNKPSVLADIIPEDDIDYRRGLGFIFTSDFRKDYAKSLQETFPNTSLSAENDFWYELSAIAAHYDDAMNDNRSELKDIVDAVSFCILAALVGPGSFSVELGRALPDEAETHAEPKKPLRFLETTGARLQPVILTGIRSDTYCTQPASGVLLKYDDERSIRLGRQADWLDKGASCIRFFDGTISKKHAEVFRRGKNWFLRDNGSTCGTLIIKAPPRNNTLLYSPGIETEAALSSGDLIVLAPINALGKEELPLGIPDRSLRFEIERLMNVAE